MHRSLRPFQFIAVLSAVLFLAHLPGCQGTGQPAVSADERPIYRPQTIDSFLEAIGPNRIIELDPAMTYRIDTARRGVSDYYFWQSPISNEHELVIRNCLDLTIRSSGPGHTHIATRFEYATSLLFQGCDGLVLERLKVGHDPDPGGCTGGVIVIEKSKNIVIRDSLLYGCGTEGLSLELVRGLSVERSVIEGCNSGILRANDSRDLRFVDSTFRDNEGYWGFSFNNTVRISFEDCAVTNNFVKTKRKPDSLFRTNLNVPESVIRFNGGKIADNATHQLAVPGTALQTAGVKVGWNLFDPSSEPRSQGPSTTE